MRFGVQIAPYLVFALGLCGATMTSGSAPAHAISLKQAVRIGLEANPDIGAAISNREAIDFELEQAQGLFLPKLNLEGRTGAQQRDAPGTRVIGTNNDTFWRNEGNLVVSQLLFDGWESSSEVDRQAARVDGAASRVLERSEFIALNIVRQYLEVGRALKVVDDARANVRYHRRILRDIGSGVTRGALSIADRQQAQERVFAAEARLTEGQEELIAAKTRFLRLVGQPIGRYQTPKWVNSAMPPNLPTAIGIARQNNPTLKIASADIDAATALVSKSAAEFYPKLSLEMLGRAGDDLDGIPGRETDLRAEVVMKWNIYNGGIDSANKQEQLRRVDEERYRLHKAHRDVEEAVRLSWDRREKQRIRLSQLRDQLKSTNKLIQSYTEQFKVGQRSLLDLLDTQNTRFNTQVGVATSRAALKFAEYRILAGLGQLLATMHVAAPSKSESFARGIVGAPITPLAETQKRWETRVIFENTRN